MFSMIMSLHVDTLLGRLRLGRSAPKQQLNLSECSVRALTAALVVGDLTVAEAALRRLSRHQDARLVCSRCGGALPHGRASC